MTTSRAPRTGWTRPALACALFAVSPLAACGGNEPAVTGTCATPAPANPTFPLQVNPDAYGHADLSGLTVMAFSQVGAGDAPDQQVLDLDPDMLIRAWQRWDVSGMHASDYNAGYPAAAHARNIAFIGGSTASAIYRDEASSAAEFLSLLSCNARGQPVMHGSGSTRFNRASLASPAYRQRLIDIGKIQIDLGVDGLFYDEVTSSYDGAYDNGNEGFDDAHVADFGGFLCAKYGDRSDAELASAFGLSPGELDCSGAAETRGRSFDYRAYLERTGWLDQPLSAQNPLAAEWGRTLDNRPDPDEGSFVQTYPSLVYWQQVVAALRSYARDVYQREIYLTSNGIYPFVDFQSVGLYDGNRDDPDGGQVDYVPLRGGHLDGATSLLPAFLALKQRSARIAGPGVPLVLFLDWPAPNMDRYFALSQSERQDYFRIFGAEAYSAGIFYALPLRTAFGDDPTATQLGMMSFFGEFAAFYRGHADLYHGAQDSTDAVTVSQADIAAHLTRLGDGRTVLHLVNHDYAAGIQGRTGVAVAFPAPQAPTGVTLVSPDYAADLPVSFTYDGNGQVHATVGELGAYVAVVAR